MTLVIRSGGSDEAREAYRASVEAVLATIRQTRSGAALLTHLEASPRTARIVPFGPRDLAENGLDNAFAQPMSGASGSLTLERTGAGTGSEIHFGVRTLRERGVQARRDEVLVHELAHALRQLTGTERFERAPGGGARLMRMAGGFDTVEEFFAAMVGSVYSSELGRPPLGNHDSATIRDPSVLARPPFSTRLREARARMPAFTADIAAIPAGVAPFNPFRDVPAA